jgi:hypothetical protein
MTFESSISAISSPESEYGAWLCALRGGPTSARFGQGHALANLSASQAELLGVMTSGTYGRTGTTSSASVDLASYLESRLRAKTDSTGSTLYTLTWRARRTPSGRSISALRASAHRTSGNDSTSLRSGWNTPATTDSKGGYQGGRIRNGKLSTDRLDVTAQLATNMRRAATGEVLNGSTAETGNGGQLNPAHSRWLMGLPVAWDECAPTATQSSRRSQQR